MGMTETERYLFDLNGYLVIPGVLSEKEADEINEVIDRVLPSWDVESKAKHIIVGSNEEKVRRENEATDPRYTWFGFYAGLLLDWGQPIRNLVGHKKILPYLKELLGPTLRLDHQYAVLMKAPSPPLQIHGGNTPYDHSEYYHFRDNIFYNGLTVASFALTDVPPGAGGFCCIPGSHKSKLPLPRSYRDLDNPADCIVQPSMRKGDVVLFTEAVTHGSLPWKASHERRALLFKYCPGHMQWEKRAPFTTVDCEWEDHQKLLLRDSYYMEEKGD